MKKKLLWKFLRTGLKSASGDFPWKTGEWYHQDNPNLCNRGFHASKTPSQAFSYVQGEILAQVEVKGDSDISDDKECWSDMRIVKAYHWKKEDSVALSIYAAELCIKNYEKVYPNDTRPREAIEAAKKWIAEPTKENESAARSAARSAESAAASAAWSAARSAARSAESAAWSAASAESAARSAAWSAESAAWSAARSAAASAASAAVVSKISKWFIKRVKVLEPYV